MKDLMTINHVMNELGVSRQTIWRWQKRGWIKVIKIGKLVRITRASVNKLKKEGKTWD